MVRIRCESCGKVYDYMKDDLCPRCGAYNNLSDTQRAEVMRQNRREHGLNDCTPECMPAGFGGHRDVGHEERLRYTNLPDPSAEQARAEKAKRRKRTALALGAAAVAVGIVLAALGAAGVFSGADRAEGTLTHVIGVSFPYDKEYTLTVEGCRDVSGLCAGELPQGTRLVAVTLTGEGSGNYADLPEPYLAVGDGYVRPVEDYLLPEGLEAPIYFYGGFFDGETGALYYLIDADADAVTFCAEETRGSGSKERVTAVHKVPLRVQPASEGGAA